ncbi:pilus assembly protein (plasmid) [Mesorhizobium sp. AaZ16]|uniref:pilus assembly protein n=1 Tax=Mesorhizobium sp. AaZ16 TaxID=3402289 RepID=UPI00374F1774
MNELRTKVLPTKRKHIAVYSADAQSRRDLAAKLDSLAIYDVQAADLDAFLRTPAADAWPSVVILDVGEGDFLNDSKIVEARVAWGAVPLIALSDELNPNQIRNMVRLNVANWLRKPLDGKELCDAVTSFDSGMRTTKSRITTFVSASGGAGATTLALSAAGYLADRSAEHAAGTCLLDLDFQNANCGAYLNLFNEFDMDGIVGHPDRLDAELMDVIKLTRKPGFAVYSFERPGLPFEPKGADFVFKLLDLAAFRFDDVIIDLSNMETPWQNAVLSTSDQIFLVFELNIVSLRKARRLYTRARESRGNAVNITLVANKRRRKLFGSHFSRGELEKFFKLPHISVLGLDTPLLTEALNRALLPSEVYARARFNKDLKLLFRERWDREDR